MSDDLLTFYLVPIAVWLGQGKRSGMWSAYLMATYDESDNTYRTICKLGVGFTEEKMSELKEQLQTFSVAEKPSNYIVGDSLHPDLWLKPAQSWKVIGADLSLSSMQTATTTDEKRVGLRFPRFIEMCDEKIPLKVTTKSQLDAIWLAQTLDSVALQN
jgi:DNA ligase 1